MVSLFWELFVVSPAANTRFWLSEKFIIDPMLVVKSRTGIRRNKINTKTALSWFVPVLILLPLLKQTKLAFEKGYKTGQPFTVKISRNIWDKNPITSAAAIVRFKKPTKTKGINQIKMTVAPMFS